MNYKPQKLEMEPDVEYTWSVDPQVKFRSNIKSERYICSCFQTKTAPYCDGAHIIYNGNLARGGEQSMPKEIVENGS